ncbi:hypothetical protein [uncultured Lamprocystis sp.]|jgi:hypothetical protein|uniref:hypothetical protein n=1 Tax=uncultured Lamprocystis sp. TaxID=543132 RepID=UPI0025CF3393|nr:hypothetical protein [uncultured Lamprocystis sp.]
MRGYLQSTTVWGLLILLLGNLWSLLWPDQPLDPARVEAVLSGCVDLLGFAVAAYGTWRRPELNGLWQPRGGA